MTKKIYQECLEIIKDLVSNDYLYFDTSVEIKITPHTNTFSLWAACVSPQNELYVMDNHEQWHKLELNDNHAAIIVGSLYQRLKLMRIQYAKAS